MQRLLLDGDPIVRVVAANATRHRASQLPAELVRALLYDKVWSVRWAIAGGLCGTAMQNEAWSSLKSSIPCNLPYLNFWAMYAEEFLPVIAQDEEVQTKLNERIKRVGVGAADLVERLLVRCQVALQRN